MRDLADRDLEERIQAWFGCPTVCTEFNVEELVFFSFWFCRHLGQSGLQLAVGCLPIGTRV